MDVVGAVLEAIAEFRPRYWVVENPKGRLRWFLGSPSASIRLSDFGAEIKKPTDLWMNTEALIPFVEGQKPWKKSWAETGQFSRIRDPAKRAALPLGLSSAILKAVQEEERP